MSSLKEGKSLSESKPALQYFMNLKPDEINYENLKKKVDDSTIDFEVAEEEDDLEEEQNEHLIDEILRDDESIDIEVDVWIILE